MLRAAAVGIGGYGRSLIGQLRKEGRVRLVAAADGRLEQLAKDVHALRADGVKVFADAGEMLDAVRGRCEAVFIASGIASHEALTVAAARAGCHVHVEKPPAATVQEVDRMIEAVNASGVLCQVGFQKVHSRELRTLKERIASGRLGPVQRIACRGLLPRDASYYGRNEWAGRLRSGRRWVLDGPATNAMAHETHTMLLLASVRSQGYAEVASVRAELYAAGDVESHNVAAMEIRTADGPTVYFLGTHACAESGGILMEIEAERSRASWDGRAARIQYEDGSVETIRADDMRASMIANFLEAVEAKDASILRCTLADARPFVVAVDAAHESSGCVHHIEGPLREIGGGAKRRTAVDGIEQVLTAAASRCELPSDLPDSPSWAVATESYDAREYDHFPRRFAGG